MINTNTYNDSSGSMLFYEEQRFRQPWIWGLLGASTLLVIGLFGYGLYRQLYLGEPWGNKPISNTALVIVSLAIILTELAIVWLLYTMTLRVKLDPAGLHIRFFPFVKRTIPLDEIRHCEARTYSPIGEYGGWGIRYGWRSGVAYNVAGNRGVQLELKDDKRVLIGSQRAEELATAIHRAMRHP